MLQNRLKFIFHAAIETQADYKSKIKMFYLCLD